MSSYPASWLVLPLSEVIQTQKGKKPEQLGVKGDVRTIPYINIAAFESKTIREYAPEQNIPKCEATETLLVWDGARAGLSGRGVSGYIGSTLVKVTSDIVDSSYLFYFIQSQYGTLNTQTKGVGIPHIDPVILNSLKFGLASSAEQTRIVEKLEELLSGLDAGVAELKAAQKKLTCYRQSLLKAAVEGALTAQWRAAQSSSQPDASAASAESGAALLARILSERRSRWETRQLAKFEAQGKTPPKDWQAKYPAPAAPDTAGLPALPEGWVWASLDQLLCELRSGTAATSGRDETGYPLLKSSAVRQGRINFDALNYLQEDQSTRQENYLEIGDVLITRLSGSVEYVGCCAVVSDLPISGIQYPDRVFCGKLAPSLMWLADFLVCCFQSSYVRKRVESAAKSSAGHKRISLSDLHPMPIPLPPSAEIGAILSQIDEALQRIQDGERDVGISLKQSAAQRKNILQAAFSGQLVPQHPADEPASALLARIRAEREKRASSAKAKKSKPSLTRSPPC